MLAYEDIVFEQQLFPNDMKKIWREYKPIKITWRENRIYFANQFTLTCKFLHSSIFKNKFPFKKSLLKKSFISLLLSSSDFENPLRYSNSDRLSVTCNQPTGETTHTKSVRWKDFKQVPFSIPNYSYWQCSIFL